MYFVIGIFFIEGMDVYRGQIRNLIEVRIISLTLMTVELQFRNLPLSIGRADIADIAEAPRAIDIGIRHTAIRTCILNQE